LEQTSEKAAEGFDSMEAADFSIWLSGVSRLNADQRREALAALAKAAEGLDASRLKRNRRRL